MKSVRTVLGLGVVALALNVGGAWAAGSYDDPKAPDSMPCVVLNRYEVQRLSQPQQQPPLYRGKAVIENVCGRAVEVRFCFQRAASASDGDRSCFAGPLRPWALASVEEPGAPGRITAPEYEWRFWHQ